MAKSGNRVSSAGFQLPTRVHESDGSLYYVHQNKWTRLCRTEQGEAALFRALAEIHTGPRRILREHFPAYIASPDFLNLAPSTQRDYLQSLKVLEADFGDAPPREVKPHHIATFLRHYGTVRANRHRGVLSSVFRFLLESGVVDANPCLGIRRNPEKPRKRYVADDEYRAAHTLASQPVRDMMDLAYLTGMRQGDLRGLRRGDLLDEGVSWREGKTERQRLVRWSDDLTRCVEQALTRSKCDRVLTNAHGQPWTLSGFQSAWKRLTAKFPAHGIQPFRFHDLRAKAATDHQDGRSLLDHAGGGVFRRHYERKGRPVDPVS